MFTLSWLNNFIQNYYYYLTLISTLNFGLLYTIYKLEKLGYAINFYSILFVAIVARLAVILIVPTLSDDYLRYIWDGRLVAKAINPYKFSPNSDTLKLFHDQIYNSLPYKDSNTIYPPFAQIIFALAFKISNIFSNNIFHTIYFLKLIWLVFDIFIIWLCKKILFLLQKNPNEIIWYALNPLVIIEIFSQGHTDLFWILSLCLSIYFILLKKPILSALSVGLGFISRIFPVLIFPFFYKMFHRKYYGKITIGFMICLVFALPLFNYEILNNFFLVAEKFTTHFEFNGGIYYLTKFILDEFHLKPSNKIAGYLINFSLLIIVAYKWLKINNRSNIIVDSNEQSIIFTVQYFIETIFYITTVQIILLSKIHVWYYVAPICISIFSKNNNLKTGWKWLVCFAPLTYYSYTLSPFQENYFLVSVEWIVFFILILPIEVDN